VSDTAEAVARVARENDARHAAVASRRAADEHGLVVLREGVANAPDTWTRFVVVSHTAVHYDPRIPAKTSLVLGTRHQQGALLECLNIIAAHDLSMTRLESRPRPQTPFEYLFYLDIEGNVADGAVREALRQLEHRASFVKLLGSYPARRTPAARAVDAPTR
jgi:prephenate dehydratase